MAGRGRAIGPSHADNLVPLTPEQVRAILAGEVGVRTTATPLRVPDIAEYCRALYPGCEHVSYDRIRVLLRHLLHNERVISIGGTEWERLLSLGVTDPQPRQRYWSIPRD